MGRAKEFEDKEALNKAMMLFWRKGYSNTSLKELLEEMEILNGSFYNCFGSKKAVFIKSLEAYQEDSRVQKGALFNSGKPFKENLRDLFEYSYNRPGEEDCPKGCFLVNSITADLLEDDEIQQTVLNGLQEFSDFIENQMSLAIRNKELEASIDVKQTTSIILSYMQGVMKLNTLNYSNERIQKEVEHFLSSLGV